MTQSETMSTLEKNIESTLQSGGWNWSDLAEELGMPSSNMSRSKNNLDSMKIGKLTQIAEILKCDIKDLFDPKFKPKSRKLTHREAVPA